MYEFARNPRAGLIESQFVYEYVLKHVTSISTHRGRALQQLAPAQQCT